MATVSLQSSPQVTHRSSVFSVCRVIGFAVLIGLSAQVKFYPAGQVIPVTLQTLAVLLCGFWLPPVSAMSAVLLYLVAGMVGSGAFAALEVGKSIVTLGYLVGFLAAAGVVSFAVRSIRPTGFSGLAAISSVGTGIVFLFGVLWIALLRGDLAIAITGGLLPFLPWAVAKSLAAAALAAAAPVRWLRS